MRRREFITFLGSAAVVPSLAWPLAARAQQPAVPVVGFLISATKEGYAKVVGEVHRGDRVKRREFITLLGGAATAWPAAAWSQQSAVPVVGSLFGSAAADQVRTGR
jgi:putative ABC transport system substrate-binding protein